MSLFNKFFGDEKKDAPVSAANWHYLEDVNQLAGIAEDSYSKPIVIFKHSTRCNISRFVLKQFEKDYNIETDKMEAYLLDLLAHRDISNEIASHFGVSHQSPQVLVIKEGKVVYDASHENIHAEHLVRFAG